MGEWVPAGSPVLSLLPAGSLKLRFYIPESPMYLNRNGKSEEARKVLGLDGASRNFEVQGILDVLRRSAAGTG